MLLQFGLNPNGVKGRIFALLIGKKRGNAFGFFALAKAAGTSLPAAADAAHRCRQ
jgi:hypothetical protein